MLAKFPTDMALLGSPWVTRGRLEYGHKLVTGLLPMLFIYPTLELARDS